jgi:predicted metal-binding protein
LTRVSAVIICKLCQWSAKHVADTPQEVAEFLGRLQKAHMNDKHLEVKQ